MIGKIFKYNDYDVYFRIIASVNLKTSTFKGKVIKCNGKFSFGHEFNVYLDYATEITEEQFNKIMVFE